MEWYTYRKAIKAMQAQKRAVVLAKMLGAVQYVAAVFLLGAFVVGSYLIISITFAPTWY